MKKNRFFLLLTIWLLGTGMIHANDQKLKMTLFKYQKPGGMGTVVSDYAVKPNLLANVKAEFSVDKQKEEIKKVFNIAELGLVSEEIIRLKRIGVEVQSLIQINGTAMAIGFTKLHSTTDLNRLVVRIRDLKQPDKEPVFETEIALPKEQIAILGFTGHDEVRYFLSFYNLVGVLSSPEIAKLPAPLKKIKDVSAYYPQIALAGRIQGVVTIEALVNEQGDVIDTNIVNGHPLLNDAALDAVRQMKFEPYLIDGKPAKASFIMNVNFLIEW